MVTTKCGFDDVPGGPAGSDLLVVNGPTLIVDIGFDPNFKPQLPNVPNPGIKGCSALVDTGATLSCIDSLLARQLNLPVVDRQAISGAHGRHDVDMYLAQVHVPTLAFTIYGTFAGVDLVAGGQYHQALIGRTFLRSFTMTYYGATGTVTLEK